MYLAIINCNCIINVFDVSELLDKGVLMIANCIQFLLVMMVLYNEFSLMLLII